MQAPAIVSEWIAINDAVAYLDRVAETPDDRWTADDLLAVLRELRAILAPHTADQAADRIRTLERARETFEHTMMRHGLGGTITEWVDIHRAIDTYTQAIVAHHADTPASAEEADLG